MAISVYLSGRMLNIFSGRALFQLDSGITATVLEGLQQLGCFGGKRRKKIYVMYVQMTRHVNANYARYKTNFI